MLINNNTNFICDNIYVHFFCSKTMNLSENNNGCIDLKNGYLTISDASTRKNIQDKIQKIGSGNQVVTLSYKSWDFGPIYARYGSDGCGVSSCSVVIKNIIWDQRAKKFQGLLFIASLSTVQCSVHYAVMTKFITPRKSHFFIREKGFPNNCSPVHCCVKCPFFGYL